VAEDEDRELAATALAVLRSHLRHSEDEDEREIGVLLDGVDTGKLLPVMVGVLVSFLYRAGASDDDLDRWIAEAQRELRGDL
jgi:hypothetical protein